MAGQNGDNGNITSAYLEYLPPFYQDDKLLKEFLLLFESVLCPLENTVDNIKWYFDPLMTPQRFLPWLAAWLDVVLDDSWPEGRRRMMVKMAAELYKWRGTKKGLTQYLEIYTGDEVEVTEYIAGMKLDKKTKLGKNTQLGSSKGGHHFNVHVRIRKEEKIEIDKIKAIIDIEKPAHTIYTLHTT